MRKMALLVTIAITGAAANQAYAKVIELNTLNPDACRQQILKGGDDRPLVFTYMVGCVWADAIRPFYEDVSEMYPNRSFYAFAFSDEASVDDDYARARTAQACLGVIPFSSPRILMYSVNPPTSTYAGRIKGLAKMGLDGSATKEDIIKFIEPEDADRKLKSHSNYLSSRE